MLIIALVLAVIGLAALVTAVVTSNELIAWVCIAASVVGVLLLIIDAIRERQSRDAVVEEAEAEAEDAEASAAAGAGTAEDTYQTFDADYPDEDRDGDEAAIAEAPAESPDQGEVTETAEDSGDVEVVDGAEDSAEAEVADDAAGPEVTADAGDAEVAEDAEDVEAAQDAADADAEDVEPSDSEAESDGVEKSS